MSIYTENGFADRKAYLEHLAETYGVDLETVILFSDANGGESEDFDGLVTSLEDYCEECE